MALHRLDVLLLAQGAGPQQLAALAPGQHLIAEPSVLITPAGVQGLQAGLNVHGGDGLALAPKRAQQLHQSCRPLQLIRPALDGELQTPQHQLGAGQVTELFQRRFALTGKGQSGFLIRQVDDEALAP